MKLTRKVKRDMHLIERKEIIKKPKRKKKKYIGGRRRKRGSKRQTFVLETAGDPSSAEK